ncbi:MAG: SRPBCC family protein [Halobacteriales archaeon]|nr:SRPBCC family protein [Halobacteriales archaeon]
MQSITVSRRIDVPYDTVVAAIEDTQSFMEAAGFDSVTVDGSSLHIENTVGLFGLEIALDLRLIEDDEALLAYEQEAGIFETMTTRYTVDEIPGDGVEVTATTDFAVDAAVIGELLDATLIKRQRRHELEAQFDYLETL